MIEKPLVLIPIQNPPKTYTDALLSVELSFIAQFTPRNLNDFSGLLLTGGGDVLSSFYNSTIPCKNVNVLRDVNEMTIALEFIKRGKPILGVCRGMQILNVLLGGTLKTVCNHKGADNKDVVHDFSCPSGILKNVLLVNSNHAQCVDKINPFAKDISTSSDGVVEAFTALDNKILAVQFHPERMSAHVKSLVYGSFSNAVYNYFANFL